MMQQLLIILLMCGINVSLEAIIPSNLFQPYDILVKPMRPPLHKFQLFVGYEGAFHTQGFLDDDEFCNVTSKGNVLQLWQKQQDAIAAFKGVPSETTFGQQAQFINMDDDDHTHGIYTPCGKLNIPVNAMFGAQFGLPYNITLGAYIAYQVASLTDVSWHQKNPLTTEEQILTPDLIPVIEELGCMNLRGWKRQGFNDLLIQAEYYLHFPQAKEYLRNVSLDIRGGVLFPTGLKSDINKLLALPFGYENGVGIQAAGRLEMLFIHNIRLGLDAELLRLFGSTRVRRVKTDAAQTDLLFLTKLSAFNSPGFVQHYTIFLDKLYWWGGFSAQVAYQYTKQNEDILYPCANQFDLRVMNNAESLQDWTTHSFITNLTYEWRPAIDNCYKPQLSVFCKWGFNGKRAILADTCGLVFSFAF